MEQKLLLLVTDRSSSFLMAVCAADALQKSLNSGSTLSIGIFPLLEAVLGYPTVSSLKQRKPLTVVTVGGAVNRFSANSDVTI